MIRLSAHPQDDLNWEIPDETGGDFYLDLGLDSFDPFDPSVFNAHFFAVQEFSRKFLHAKRVILAKLDGQFSRLFKPSEKLECCFNEFSLDYELFCAGLFSEYLHRLASALLDETTPVLVFELAKECDFAHMILCFCRRRFEHFQLEFSGPSLPIDGHAPIAISLPQDELFQREKFKELLESLKDLPYKCIPEEFLNEHWEGVDHLVIDLSTMGELGRRMLFGFEATGGQIVTLCGNGGFENEITLEKFLQKKS